ncbi:hypothetical protein O4M77_06410 [Acinetobacter sp. YWS30-1]|uniref:Uncharacterized protein n=1 Tax=Acinetobacter variabilis TaxID=70346 RepID=A0A7T8AQJ9_9GAMM|nr:MULTISPECIES: hypothetical protein [Acinetobacter]QQN89276.1 hypothetical protein IAQ69_06385 [Acinetobacter variabilis]WPC36027.1 hypothetical protein O4M77_06410 [Acinetobacter sp. YWS30-1]
MKKLPHKVARICWNSNHWTAPSGITGKSKDINSFENIYGFGFEEWNFDLSKVIDGYIYGYIPAASAGRISNTIDPIFTLSLYTIENQKKYNQRWWIGTINQVELVNTSKSKEIYAIYEKNGWINERFDQLKNLGIDYFQLLDIYAEQFFNIRYKLKDVNLLEEPLSFDHKNPAVTSNYYNFLNFTTLPNDIENNILDANNPNQKENFYRKTYTIEAANFQKIHSIVHNLLIKDLKLNFKKDQIFSEYFLNNNTRVDIAIQDESKSFILYEIKIARNLRDAIRQSIGQLLEYSFTLQYQNVKEMNIVSIFDVNDPVHINEKRFLKSLEKYLKIPISYHYVKIENT